RCQFFSMREVQKSSKSGLAPIYQRITINGVRIELSTSKFVEKSKWNPSADKMRGTSEEARIINSYLEILKLKAYETEKDAKRLFPKELWNKLHLQIIYYARAYSPARGWDLEKDVISKGLGIKA